MRLSARDRVRVPVHYVVVVGRVVLFFLTGRCGHVAPVYVDCQPSAVPDSRGPLLLLLVSGRASGGVFLR